MKADTVDLAAIFGKPVHYVVPLYQRPYVWTKELQWVAGCVRGSRPAT